MFCTRNKSILALTSALTAGLIVTAAAPARAAVPLSTIQGWKDSAPEALEITVLKVDESDQAAPVRGAPGCVHTHATLTVTAQINVAWRSSSGLAPGNVVVFTQDVMSTWPCVMAGANLGPSLAVGSRAAVYLRPAQSEARQLVTIYVERLY
jgi:hypothetical protein